MNRGFNYYFREGVRSSSKALYKNKGLFRYLIYFFMELLGRVTVLFNALFDFSDNRQGEQIRKASNIDVSQSFKNVPRGLWTYILTLCVEALMFVAGVLIIAVITGVLALIGYFISTISTDLNPEMMIGIFSAPGGLLFIIYSIVMYLIFSPTAYIIATNEGISVGDTLSACFNTMKSNGKGTVFLGLFVTSLIKLAYIGIAFGIYILLAYLLKSYSYEWFYPAVLILWGLIALAGFALVAPIFTLANRSLKNHLFNDIAIDPISKTKDTNGINITQFNGQKIGAGAVGNALVMLFDETGGEAKQAPVITPRQTVDLSQAFMNEPVKNKKPTNRPLTPTSRTAPLKSIEPEDAQAELPEEEQVPTVGGEIKQAQAAINSQKAEQPVTAAAVQPEAEEEQIPTVGGLTEGVQVEEQAPTDEVPTVGGEIKEAEAEIPVQPVRPPVRPAVKPAETGLQSEENAQPPVKPAAKPVEKEAQSEENVAPPVRPATRPAAEMPAQPVRPVRPEEAKRPVPPVRPAVRPAVKPASEAPSAPSAPARPVKPANRGTPVVRVLKSADSDDDDGFNDALPENGDDDGFEEPVTVKRMPKPSIRVEQSDDDDGFDDGFEEPAD